VYRYNNLYNNQIGDQGAQKLADALKVNQVSFVFSKPSLFQLPDCLISSIKIISIEHEALNEYKYSGSYQLFFTTNEFEL